MIEISLGKLVLLALIALIVLGPEKLPGAARTAGALLRRVRSGWDNVRSEVERELEVEEIKRAAREAAAQAEAAQNAMKDTAQQAHQPLADAYAMMRAKPVLSPLADAVEPVPADAGATDLTDAAVQADLPLGEPPAHHPETPHGGH